MPSLQPNSKCPSQDGHPVMLKVKKKSQYSSNSKCPFKGGHSLMSKDKKKITILQGNIKGLMLSKLDVLNRPTSTNKANVVLLQEKHKEINTTLKHPGFAIVGHTNSKHLGLAIFVKEDIQWALTGKSPENTAVKWIPIKVHETTIISMCKLPLTRLE